MLKFIIVANRPTDRNLRVGDMFLRHHRESLRSAIAIEILSVRQSVEIVGAAKTERDCGYVTIISQWDYGI